MSRARPRLAIAGISHETNTFSSLRTGMDDFRVRRGPEILDDGLYQSFPDIEWVPTLQAGASPNGLVEAHTYRELRDELIERLVAAGQVDGVYLALHGAMEVEDIGDGETDLVRSVRSVVGPDVPLVASMDLHGNLTPEIAEQMDLLTALRTAPHVDGDETRRRALSHLIRCVREDLHPSNVLLKLPLLLPGEHATTIMEPGKSLYEGLRRIEQMPGILDASIFISCAWTDSPYTSVSVVVVAESDPAPAHSAATALAHEVWDRRTRFSPDVETLPIREVLQAAMKADGKLALISDSGDNPTAGGAGDTPLMLKAMLDLNVSRGLVAGIADASAVAACSSAWPGVPLTVDIGGKLDATNAEPFRVVGNVVRVVPGEYAILQCAGTAVVLTTGRKPFQRADDFHRIGLDPLDYAIVVVKQGYLFADFREIASANYMALSPGFTSLDLHRLPYNRIRRPIWPLDPDTRWNAECGVRSAE
jgi:microcystin degradation protein MlrC